MIRDTDVGSEVVAGFGDEWTRFDQSELPDDERRRIFDSYFALFPWSLLAGNAEGFDLGCGSGRWARLVAPRVGRLHCIDPSAAIDVAWKSLADLGNCAFYRATVDAIPVEDASMDFGYSLGVLHHLEDTQAGMAACVRKLKPGAPFLVYIYYALENRPIWFRTIWRISNGVRSIVSRCPYWLRYGVSQVIALLTYWPLARLAWLMERAGVDVSNVPLTAYRSRSFYTMRTDALDRFGTRLERRFSRETVKTMMEEAGLERVECPAREPFWCAVGYRRSIDRDHADVRNRRLPGRI